MLPSKRIRGMNGRWGSSTRKDPRLVGGSKRDTSTVLVTVSQFVDYWPTSWRVDLYARPFAPLRGCSFCILADRSSFAHPLPLNSNRTTTPYSKVNRIVKRNAIVSKTIRLGQLPQLKLVSNTLVAGSGLSPEPVKAYRIKPIHSN